MPKHLRKPNYWGSKSSRSPLGKWIISLIPWDYKTTYVEPFAGMLGVLLGRKPVMLEIVNDLDGNLYNWWCVIRDEPEELSRLISLTPFSRQGLRDAFKIVKKPKGHSKVQRALALYTVLEQSIHRRMDTHPNWRIQVKPTSRSDLLWSGNEVYPLAERLKNVQIENRDAIRVLKRVCKERNAVIYCDPPYPTADTSHYNERVFNVDAMVEILRETKARVAISGYGTEWDMLGWQKHEKEVIRTLSHAKMKRVEVVWTNYQPQRQGILL